MSVPYSFIVLTYNEELHLPRLLQSIAGLNATVFIVDSGSTDNTIKIATDHGAQVLQHPFENHPLQWDFALKNCAVQTSWIICLDADQVVTSELRQRLLNFKDEDHSGINGIYFNRKNFFKGRWIKHGGYYPFYLLKMFRYGVGHSDIAEKMDHRFMVPGETEIWKDGYLLEENLKENNISFWIDKHNRWIGENVGIDNIALVTIGSNVCLSQGAVLLTGSHDYKKPAFDLITGGLIIEDRVWIGAGAIVNQGLTIGSHAVLITGSIATKNLEPYTIYRGNPAVKIRERVIE